MIQAFSFQKHFTLAINKPISMKQKSLLLAFLMSIPLFVTGQTSDSLVVVKQLDSLLRQLRPLVEQQKLETALEIVGYVQETTLSRFGKTHPINSICLAYRGKIAQRQEKFKEAVRWYLEAMALQEQLFGKESPQIVVSMSTLSTIYLAMGEYVRAEPLILETLAIREKLVGKKHPDYARTLGTLGSLHYHKGDYFKAELLYLEAMGIFEKTLGKKHPDYAVVLGNLSSVYAETGNFAKAEPLIIEVSEIYASVVGKQNPLYIKSLSNLSRQYTKAGNLGKSEELDLEILSQFNHGLSKENSDYVNTLSDLGSIYLKKGEYEKAEPLLFEAETISAKIYGKENHQHASTIKALGICYTAKGEYDKAESVFLEAHAINTRTLEADHPNCAQTAAALAHLYQETNRLADASVRFLEAEGIDRRNIEKASGYSSEAELAYFLQNYEESTAKFYSFAQYYDSPPIAEASYDNAVFYKGFLLNARMQVKARAQSDSIATQKLGFIYAYRRRLTEQYSLPVAERDSAVIAGFEEQANALEKELARTMVGYSEALRQVNWKAIQAALKPGESAIEFIHFQQYNIKGKATDSVQYAALVLRPDDTAPDFIPLFEEQALVSLLQGASGGNYRKINGLYASNQQKLYDLIWKKLEPGLNETNRVYCSLSGWLHRLDLGAIPLSATQTIADRYQLVVLGSTRQLAIPSATAKYNNQALLIGGVNYAENPAAKEELLSLSRGSQESALLFRETDSLTRSESWNFLPATLTEVLNLRRLLQAARMQVQLDSGYSATEESIKQLGNSKASPTPRVLHFATHGYFFPDPHNKDSNGKDIAFKTAKNPLLRSGLILAGAQQAWTTGKAPAGREDGVLTAQEISLLNLSGTELVVLSACETGLGDIDGNEGVYGLQRAFKIAGAKYIIMSLWKVNDQTTAEFMTAFYTQWLKKGLDIPKAFQNAQNSIKSKYPEAYHWAGFVLVE